MRDQDRSTDIEQWLSDVRLQFVETAPNLLPLFETYAAEAAFGRQYIAQDLAKLRQGACILEVGAGSLLVSCQLMREGYSVTALEPIGSGFSHFDQMRGVVLTTARARSCSPLVVDIPAEKFSAPNSFDYAFSVNVMEHVNDVAAVIEKVGGNLKVGAGYRFTCPNYLFPYEPHFNIPTFFSKSLTQKLMGEKIFNSKIVPDPKGTWQSLNWITVFQIARHVRSYPWLSVSFNRSMLFSTLARVVTDASFAGRRSSAMSALLKAVVKLRIHHLFRLVPAGFQPILDCDIRKISKQEAC